MKKLFLNLFVVLGLAFCLISCGDKKLQYAQFIPKEASLVMVFDEESIKQKLKTGNYDVDSIIAKFLTKMDTSKNTKLLESWKNSGIDINNKFVMYVFEDKKNANGLNNTANFLFSLTDGKKFETFLKNTDDLKTAEVKREKNYSYIKLDGEAIISWNENTAIFTANSGNVAAKFNPMTSQYRDENRDNNKLIKIVDRLYNLKDEDKIASIDAFNKMMDKKADAYVFTSMSSLANQLKSLPIQILKLEELLDKNYTVGYINFENGKINFESTSYYNDKLNSLLKQYDNANVKLSMLDNFPVNTVDAVMLASFKPEMLEGLLKELQLDAFVENGLAASKTNVTTKEFLKCLNGNFALAMGDFSNPMLSVNLTNTESKESPSKNTTKVLFVAEVGDYKNLLKILNSEMAKQFLKEENGAYVLKSIGTMPVYLRIDEKNLIITESEETYKAYAAKNVKASFNSSLTSNLTNKSSAFYINVNSIMRSFASIFATNPSGNKIGTATLNTFDDMVLTSNHIENGKQESSGYIKFKNDKENSLVSMANLIKLIVIEAEKKEDETSAEISPDQQRIIDSTLNSLQKN